MRCVIISLCCLIAPAVFASDKSLDLFAAARQGTVSRVEAVLLEGVDANARLPNGRTALMAASFFGNERIVRLLLGWGADVNASDDRGVTALMDAVSGGWLNIVRLLVTAGANVNATDKSQQSVLDRARQTGHRDILALLEQAGNHTEEDHPAPPPLNQPPAAGQKAEDNSTPQESDTDPKQEK